ncbi:LOW QUALITY PROTEIN: hypothetical protein OSB04_017312 [Centaurea solstitialis]|uniref:F-box domain-containing protein n=1 Tax=Centaurea solstitialis TaxID=347529 RepID=A0AA38W9C8_9ASTR|nr:LOW QUALITY PROTEIN: hypothetical protein OSB04_017312 [Centaurea solstitialis]
MPTCKMAPTTINNLPLDVLSRILIRFRAKPLARMRCVSKPWNSLLSQPAFIKSHLHRSIQNNQEILMVFAIGFPFDHQQSPFTTAHLSKFPHLVIPNFIQIPVVDPNLSEWSTCYHIHGSVNGLICLSYKRIDEPVIQIWNPSLSAMLTLPPYANPFGSTDKNFIQFGFGFDPKTDDYKIIKFMIPKPMIFLCLFNGLSLDFDDNLPSEKIQVEIYKSVHGNQWFPPNVTRIDDRDEMAMMGTFIGLVILMSVGSKKAIVAFDLGDETFSEICLPVDNLDRQNTLGILGGKLCVMSCVEDHDCQVWVMNEYRVVESWTKNHAFSQFSFEVAPYGFTLNNEFLCEPSAGYNRRLALYDPSEAKVKYFKFAGRLLSNVKVVEYVDSLVWTAPRGSASRKD